MIRSELREGMIMDLECPRRHKAVIVCDAEKFEALFNMGSSALLDGYGREAVSSFAATLERFHEFAIRVFLAKQKVSREQFDLTWKLAANQTERQVGGYYFLHLAHFNSAPSANQMKTEFRNSVIHKGMIPTDGEAFEYGEFVYDYIVGSVKMLRKAFDEEVNQVRKDNLQRMLDLVPSGTRKIVKPFWSMIGLDAPKEKFGMRSFKEIFEVCREDHWLELEERLEDYLNREED